MLTPAQRIAGIGAAAEREVELDHLLDASAAGSPGWPSMAVARRVVADDDDVGLAAVQQAERHAGIGRDGTASPGPSITSQWSGAASGLSISAAPAAKSETTASIGMPPPAIMIPVWPVARKSASTPRCCEARARSRARCISCRARSRCRRSAAACRVRLRPVATGMSGRRRAHVDQPPAEPLRRPRAAAGCRRAATCMPLTMSSPASSASTSAGIQLRRMTPPRLATPITSARAPARRGLGGRQARQPGGDRRARQREFADAFVRAPSRAGRTRSWHSPARSCRRGTADRASADRAVRPGPSASPPVPRLSCFLSLRSYSTSLSGGSWAREEAKACAFRPRLNIRSRLSSPIVRGLSDEAVASGVLLPPTTGGIVLG